MSLGYESIIIISLRRSRVRRLVLEYLYSISPYADTLTGIARSTGLTPLQVSRALWGGGGYKKDQSLINLNLALCIMEKRRKLYKISEYAFRNYEKIRRIVGMMDHHVG